MAGKLISTAAHFPEIFHVKTDSSCARKTKEMNHGFCSQRQHSEKVSAHSQFGAKRENLNPNYSKGPWNMLKTHQRKTCCFVMEI